MTWKAICFSICLPLPKIFSAYKEGRLNDLSTKEKIICMVRHGPGYVLEYWVEILKIIVKNILDTIVEILYKMQEQMRNASEELKTVNNT